MTYLGLLERTGANLSAQGLTEAYNCLPKLRWCSVVVHHCARPESNREGWAPDRSQICCVHRFATRATAMVRQGWDSNPRGYRPRQLSPGGFKDRCNKPLCHPAMTCETAPIPHGFGAVPFVATFNPPSGSFSIRPRFLRLMIVWWRFFRGSLAVEGSLMSALTTSLARTPGCSAR